MPIAVDLVPGLGQRRSVRSLRRSGGAEAAPDEVAVVFAAQAGDRDAFARLHARYARMVHGILLARVPAGEAEDLVQDVFLTALRALARVRSPGAVGPWLARITRNRANDFHRRRRRHEDLPDELPADAPPSAEASEALAAIRSLPEAYQETLILRLVEGMTGPEIAERVGMTHGSVRVNLHRGMKQLRERLGMEERP